MTYQGLCKERETACTYPHTCLPLRHICTFLLPHGCPPPHPHTEVMSDSSVQWLYSCTSYSVFTLLCYIITGTEYLQFQSMQEVKKERNWKKRELTLYMCNSKPRINLKELQVFLINIELSSSLSLLCAH